MNKGRLESLDTLRGAAILMVILFHVSARFPPGDLAARVLLLGNSGVQLFFLVSAVTMCHMWEQRADESHRWAKFYIRRVFRIAPLFWFAMLFYTLAEGTAPHAQAYEGIGPFQLVLTALFLHGFAPSAINAVVPGGWSIAIEMSFYVVFPLLAMLRPGRLMGVAFVAYIVFGILLTQLLIRFDGGEHMSLFLYYSLLTQFPVFLVGMLLYWVAIRRAPLPVGRIAAVAALWLATALIGKYVFNTTTRPFFWIEVGVLALATCLILVRQLSNAALAFMGRLSYSMYLFHFAVITGVEKLAGTALPFLAAAIATLLVTIAIGMLSQRTAERWSQNAGRALAGMLDAARLEPGAPPLRR
jgi:peptidoglycan/LPS O-acetylase OafA/YrhL